MNFSQVKVQNILNPLNYNFSLIRYHGMLLNDVRNFKHILPIFNPDSISLFKILKKAKRQILWNGFAHVEKRYLKIFRISKYFR
jgi:hypothetical protein